MSTNSNANVEFTMDKKIGSGTFGDVFSGVYQPTKEKIAIKRVKKKTLYQYGNYLIDAFWKELDCMKKCECKNSVRLIKPFETQNNFNIIMELCDTDLLIHLNHKSSGFTIDEVRDIFNQLNNVFKIMQRNNIVHRDLKLGNIMLKYTDEAKTKFIPKLSDYGFSKDLKDINGTHLGTPATMAPEIMMDSPYNEKSDLWSIGVMLYQLHFKELPYSGINEQEILTKIKRNAPRKQPKDPQFKDLLNRLFIVDPKKRISWNDYFNHPFFMTNNPQNNGVVVPKYTKISDFNLGYNFDQNLFQCYIAKDSQTNNQVFIKSYKNEFFEQNSQVFSGEIAIFKAFNGNKNVLKLINIYNEADRVNLVYEYLECEMLYNYSQKKPMKEREIRNINKKLYENVFVFNECNFLPFIFISIHSFCIDKYGNPIVFDFGSHKLFLSKEEFSSYFLPNEIEIEEYNKQPIKTNIMNYGITLLKLYCGNNLTIKGKELILSPNIILSNVFNNFISKCIYRNINKRWSWLQLGEDSFIVDDSIGVSNIVGKDALLDNDKLKIIFSSLKNKFELVIDYYSKLDYNQNLDYIQQIEYFIVITSFEAKIIYNFFNRKVYERPFTKQNEIDFISINENSEVNKFCLNFANPLLKDTTIINMNKNKLIKDFLNDLAKYSSKLDKISKKVHSHSKNSKINGKFNEFIKYLLDNFENSKIQEYFFSVVRKADKEADNSLSYKELCLAEYLCEFILFVKIVLYDKEEDIPFDKKILIKKFFDIFGEDKNSIEISVINLKEEKKVYILVSFLAILFKNYKGTNMIDNQKLERNRQAINGLLRFYPSLMKKIVEKKKFIKA